MPDLESESHVKKGKPKDGADTRINPDGIYSGMTKRLAISDDAFVSVQKMPPDSRKSGRLKANNVR